MSGRSGRRKLSSLSARRRSKRSLDTIAPSPTGFSRSFMPSIASNRLYLLCLSNHSVRPFEKL